MHAIRTLVAFAAFFLSIATWLLHRKLVRA